MDKLNKEGLLKLLETVKCDKEEFWLLSTSLLVLRDIEEYAGDLDIAVSDKGFEELSKNYDLKPKGDGFYIVTDKIEAVCDGPKELLKYQPEKVGDYYTQNIFEYREYLLKSDREKDIRRLALVEDYIKNNYETR